MSYDAGLSGRSAERTWLGAKWSQSQFGYLMALDGEGNSEEPVYGPCYIQYDLRSGQCAEHFLGEGTRGAEPVWLVPAENAQAEDELGTQFGAQRNEPVNRD